MAVPNILLSGLDINLRVSGALPLVPPGQPPTGVTDRVNPGIDYSNRQSIWIGIPYKRGVMAMLGRFISGALFFLSITLPAHSDETVSADFKYGPDKVSLEGKVIKKTFFGPPGFGEDPRKDSQETQYLLELMSPIHVEANSTNVAEDNVREVTIVIGDFKKLPVRTFLNKPVKVTGTLIHSYTGHHGLVIPHSSIWRPRHESSIPVISQI